MRKIAIVLIAMCLVSATAFAYEVGTPDEIKNTYNSQINNIPDFAKEQIGNERFHIYLIGTSTREYAAITENALITEIGVWNDTDNDGNHDSWQTPATMELRIEESLFGALENSTDPTKTFTDAWGKEIAFKGLNIGSQVKLFFMNIGLTLANMFG